MQRLQSEWAIVAWCTVLTLNAFGGPATEPAPRRIYVEAFATKTGAEELRGDLVSELRKVSSITIVPDARSADLIMAGGGEIWIKGYRSFSPRSHMKMSTNGTPVYGGFLSVELKNRQGITVWSYLATPGASSTDISKEISKRIAKHVAEALTESDLSTAPPLQHASITLHAAGATFPATVYQKWFTNFQAQDPATAITYDAIGSEAGIRKLLEHSIDFGASDNPQIIHEIAPGDSSRYLLFPSVIGAVAPVVNLPGVTEAISFTPEALAGIFLGKIKKWNDPVLQRINRGINLPDLDIIVVHRADGSGTTYAWTDYLSQTSTDWKAEVGASLAPKWPVGRSATGNDGVAKLVKELGGAIGYVEYIYALQNHLSYGRVRNRNGEYVEPSLESIASAVSHSADLRDDFGGSIVNAPGEDAYPVASFTWFVVPVHIADDAKRNALTTFLKWMLGPGQRQAAALGFLALPKEIVAREQAMMANIR